jgi:S-adenosylmethionine:tRNA ribosyltransferase-isomerase
MRDPKTISIHDYTYELPEDRIAKHPLAVRDASKLLIYKNGNISERLFRNLAEELPEETLLVFNNTRVIRARLAFYRETGGRIELFCTEPDQPADIQVLLQQVQTCKMKCLVGNLKKWKTGEVLLMQLEVNGKPITFSAHYEAPVSDLHRVRFEWTGDVHFADVLEACGKIPLPPYMKRDEESGDSERYQTIFAEQQGSVAAPTASLHFTPQVLEELQQKNITTEYVTLHVGAGTFKPVKSDTLAAHDMHREEIFVPFSLVEKFASGKYKTIVAAGTTALRTIESLYWFGLKMLNNPGKHYDRLFVSQWEPYEYETVAPAPVVFRALRDWMQENNIRVLSGTTGILIAPGYRFQAASGLITNFHQPESTLLLLVAAFTNENHNRVYDYALQHDFRFLSYGDSSLLWRE